MIMNAILSRCILFFASALFSQVMMVISKFAHFFTVFDFFGVLFWFVFSFCSFNRSIETCLRHNDFNVRISGIYPCINVVLVLISF